MKTRLRKQNAADRSSNAENFNKQNPVCCFVDKRKKSAPQKTMQAVADNRNMLGLQPVQNKKKFKKDTFKNKEGWKDVYTQVCGYIGDPTAEEWFKLAGKTNMTLPKPEEFGHRSGTREKDEDEKVEEENENKFEGKGKKKKKKKKMKKFEISKKGSKNRSGSDKANRRYKKLREDVWNKKMKKKYTGKGGLKQLKNNPEEKF